MNIICREVTSFIQRREEGGQGVAIIYSRLARHPSGSALVCTVCYIAGPGIVSLCFVISYGK